MAKKRKINQEKNNQNCECKTWKFKGSKGCSGFFYFLGFLGTAIYYIGQATTFWQGVLGFLKAIIWPLFLVLKVLGM